MQRYRRFAVFAGVLIIAVGSVILLTAIFANAGDAALQRSLLRLMAVLGFVAIVTMCGSLLMRAEDIDHLASQPLGPRPPRQ